MRWIAQANILAQLRGWSPFVGLQIEYSLIERTVERELIPMAKALSIGVTAWSTLAGGVLTGKYHGHGAPEQGRMNSDMLKDFMPERERTDRILAAVKSVSDETGCFDLTLSAEQLKTLDEASQIELGFPYDMCAKAMPRAVCYGGLRDQILA
jgi:aryl-alcohol dehydrogenase-like predicted oxidoreductase